MSTYKQGVQSVYEGELAASILYRALSEKARDDDVRAKFAAISAVEGHTARALKPVAERLGIAPRAPDLEARARERLEQLGRLSWSEFIQQADRNWPPYIAHFEALQRQAPPEDGAIMQFLVDHEVALVAFVSAEVKASLQGRASLSILDGFLSRDSQPLPR